jgi:hypothetical protein
VLTIGIAVDAALRHLCRLNDVQPGKPCTLPMANALAAAGVIEPTAAKVLAWIADLRGRAIGTQWKTLRPVTPDEAAQAVERGARFIASCAG